MNDDLVAKKFALYDSQLSDNDGLDEADQEPIMLSSSILRRQKCMITKNLTAQTQPLPGKHTRGSLFYEQHGSAVGAYHLLGQFTVQVHVIMFLVVSVSFEIQISYHWTLMQCDLVALASQIEGPVFESSLREVCTFS